MNITAIMNQNIRYTYKNQSKLSIQFETHDLTVRVPATQSQMSIHIPGTWSEVYIGAHDSYKGSSVNPRFFINECFSQPRLLMKRFEHTSADRPADLGFYTFPHFFSF